jgi:hypothetical protein
MRISGELVTFKVCPVLLPSNSHKPNFPSDRPEYNVEMTKIFTFPECNKPMEEFYRWYGDPMLLIAQKDTEKRLKPREERTCRYCNKAEPLTTFTKDAHIVSQLLGKNDLLCDYECDA